MIKSSQCSNCAKIFSYNDRDSKGKFCSRSCHYKSKKHMAICKNCSKDFVKSKKEMRQTCSEECYKIRRAMKSKNDKIRELAHAENSKNAGQTTIDKNISPSIPSVQKDIPIIDGEKFVAPEIFQRFPFAGYLNSFKMFVKNCFLLKKDK